VRRREKEQFEIREYEGLARTLDAVAKNYPKKSAEFKAIELAAKALVFACECTVTREFKVFLRKWDKKLFSQPRQHLKRMALTGIDKVGKKNSKLSVRKN
jgi:hypothetical protein